MKIFIFYILLITLSVNTFGQLGIQLNTPEATDGYALITTERRAVLVDNCGEVVHSWDDIGIADNHYKLLPNGNLNYISNSQVYERTWDNEEITGITVPDVILEYEVEILPNGNYLCVGRRPVSQEEFVQMGYNLNGQNPSQLDVVVEIDRNTEEIVWEWNIGDHMIQERDSDLGNYGVVKDNPQLLNMDAISTYDWTFRESFMINSMDYNPTLDQIVLSVRKMSEFVIIDHSTTTEEARGSSGGNQGKGGDILYRWGNPQNYDQGSAEDRQLYFQHNPNWIIDGPDAGKISVYNNGLNRPGTDYYSGYSSADIIDTGVNSDGSYTLEPDSAFEPAVATLSYNQNTVAGLEFNSGYLSGATQLTNGNMWITVGGSCLIMELNPAGDEVWRYQYDTDVFCFRSVKYASDYPAFDDKDLTPNGTIEMPSSTYDCLLISSSTFIQDRSEIDAKYNQQNKSLSLINADQKSTGMLFDIQGRPILHETILTKNSILDLNLIKSGFYIFSIFNKNNKLTYSKKLIIQ